MRRIHVGTLVAAALVVGCSKPPGVEGDISLGAEKGMYRRVSLVRNTGDSVLAAVDAACQAERDAIQRSKDRLAASEAARERFKQVRGRTQIEQAALSDSVDKYRNVAMGEQRALSERPDTLYGKNVDLLRAATDTEVQADKDGHFRIPKRKSGKYVLYVDWTTNKGQNEFLAPVELAAKGIRKQNLDQSTVSTRLHCR